MDQKIAYKFTPGFDLDDEIVDAYKIFDDDFLVA
jgi:hypothetical protein